jgi:hypothetical protein
MFAPTCIKYTVDQSVNRSGFIQAGTKESQASNTGPCSTLRVLVLIAKVQHFQNILQVRTTYKKSQISFAVLYYFQKINLIPHMSLSGFRPTWRTIFQCVYFMPLHISNKCSSSGGPTCVNTSSGITHWWVSVWRAGQELPPDRHVRQSPTRVGYTRGCLVLSWSSWWWALVARNKQRHEINTLRKSASCWSLTRITSRCTVNKI